MTETKLSSSSSTSERLVSACSCLDRLYILQTAKTVLQVIVCIILPIIFVYNVQIQSSFESSTVSKMGILPPPDQTWVHAVDNRRTLQEALQDDKITAIETDILMGQSIYGSIKNANKIPIMAHPPNTQSDLSMIDFLHLVSKSNTEDLPTIQKVIKLDFKELETVEPTLQAIAERKVQTDKGASIFLNADILPGPGHREDGAVTIGAEAFLEICLQYIPQSKARIAFSLGFKTDYTDPNGYTQADLDAMAELIARYRLMEQDIGVVLAINARQLAKSLSSFDAIMVRYPEIQILVWTGKGEPPIPQSLFESIEGYFHGKDMSQRIGYDCQITQDYFLGVSTELFVSSFACIKLAFALASV